MLPNGHIELAVQLVPSAYAALVESRDRDRINFDTIVSVALIVYDQVSPKAAKDGRSFRDVHPEATETVETT